jgi:membrane protein implicated in regulation of membrane protease activity
MQPDPLAEGRGEDEDAIVYERWPMWADVEAWIRSSRPARRSTWIGIAAIVISGILASFDGGDSLFTMLFYVICLLLWSRSQSYTRNSRKAIEIAHALGVKGVASKHPTLIGDWHQVSAPIGAVSGLSERGVLGMLLLASIVFEGCLLAVFFGWYVIHGPAPDGWWLNPTSLVIAGCAFILGLSLFSVRCERERRLVTMVRSEFANQVGSNLKSEKTTEELSKEVAYLRRLDQGIRAQDRDSLLQARQMFENRIAHEVFDIAVGIRSEIRHGGRVTWYSGAVFLMLSLVLTWLVSRLGFAK